MYDPDAAIAAAIDAGDADALRMAFEDSHSTITTYTRFSWYWMQAITHYPGHCRVFDVLKAYTPTNSERQPLWSLDQGHTMEMKDAAVVQWFITNFGVSAEETGLHKMGANATDAKEPSPWFFPKTRAALRENLRVRFPDVKLFQSPNNKS